MVFCTFAGVNFLTESVPESRSLHLTFQKKKFFFPGVTPPDWTPAAGGGDQKSSSGTGLPGWS